jgi:UDP:flavonoid glycosyltransferase YjiC (YdhE family)
MSTIVIAMLPELGHINPTLKLASSLRLRGHQVCYLIGPDYEAYMRAQGFKSISLGEQFTRARHKSSSQLDVIEYLQEARMQGWALNEYYTSVVQVFRQEIAALISKFRPNLFLLDPYVPDIALIARELGQPFVFLCPTLINPLTGTPLLNSQPDLGQVPELILCAGEFDFPQSRHTGKKARYYLGSSVDLQRKEDDPFDWQKLDPTKRLLHCSLGSQPQNLIGAKRFFRILIDVVSDLDDCQLIVVTGAHFANDFPSVPQNVIVAPRVPQLRIIKRADVLITHGGLSTIKEAILLGTPMIVLPSITDQPANAARVAYHHLGVTGDMATVTPEQVRALIERVMQPHFRERVLAFQKTFQNIDAAEMDVRIVEALLASLAKKSHAMHSTARY